MPNRRTGRVIARDYDKSLVIKVPDGKHARPRGVPTVQLNFSGPPVTWKKYYDRLRACRLMEADQASLSFPAPGVRTITLAHSFLEFLQEANYPPARVMPAAVGGIGFVFRRRRRKVYVEFNNKAPVLSLFSDGVSKPVVQRVDATREGYSSWITPARAYLDE